jgi:predicted  nucleic acid-binding Zn-ribbon protein
MTLEEAMLVVKQRASPFEDDWELQAAALVLADEVDSLTIERTIADARIKQLEDQLVARMSHGTKCSGGLE